MKCLSSGRRLGLAPHCSVNRRDFLHVGAIALGGFALPTILSRSALGTAAAARQSKSVIFVYLAGGPSHLDMYDMKPDAPAEIRGEFRPIGTNVPGVYVCEHLPLHAKIADRFTIVNGVETVDTHSSAVVTIGRPAEPNEVAAGLHPAIDFQTPALPHGNWDTHGKILGRELSIFSELRDKLPAYDRFIYKLISDLYERGLDKDVLVVACGEFGRTPWINKYGGRDHWAPCGSVLFAGGGLEMGQVIGNTGPIGEREQLRCRPYTAQNVLAMIYRHLGVYQSPLFDDGRLINELT